MVKFETQYVKSPLIEPFFMTEEQKNKTNKAATRGVEVGRIKEHYGVTTKEATELYNEKKKFNKYLERGYTNEEVNDKIAEGKASALYKQSKSNY